MTIDCAGDFELEDGVAYLNAAYMAPTPRIVSEAGRAGIAQKAQPWKCDRARVEAQVEHTRKLAAKLIGASADDIAIVGSVSYGIAIGCGNLGIPRGSRLLFMEDEHHSVVLSMRALAERSGAVLDAVLRPENGDWTRALLARLSIGGPPVSIAALTPVHWIDGTMIDLDRIACVLRENGAHLIVDATQAAGIVSIDVQTLRPDILVFPTYKWLLGPYGLAFLYVAPSLQTGSPLEEHALNRQGLIIPIGPSEPTPAYAPGARRFDRGEVEGYITVPMAHSALTYLAQLNHTQASAHIASLSQMPVRGLARFDFALPPAKLRSQHIVCFHPPANSGQRVADALAVGDIVITQRHGVCRVSPHVYNTLNDIERLLDAVAVALRRS